MDFFLSHWYFQRFLICRNNSLISKKTDLDVDTSTVSSEMNRVQKKPTIEENFLVYPSNEKKKKIKTQHMLCTYTNADKRRDK